MRRNRIGTGQRRMALVAAVVAAALFADGETLWLDVLGGSAGILGDAQGHAAGAVVFADMDADGEEEVVAIEATSHRMRRVTISRLGRVGRTVEQTIGWFDRRYRMLVGNLAGDGTPELVLFSTTPPRDDSTTEIVQWDGDSYTSREFDRTGALGTLVDFDGDGVAELVFATPKLADALPTDPVELRAYAFTGEALRLMRRQRLAHGVVAMAAADLDGDGGDELVTVEKSRYYRGTGTLAVYGAAETEFRPLFREDQVLADIDVFVAFKSGGKPYLYAERGAFRWRTVLRLSPDGEGSFALETVRGAQRLSLLEDAFKATAAYSAERQTHYRFVGADRLEPW